MPRSRTYEILGTHPPKHLPRQLNLDDSKQARLVMIACSEPPEGCVRWTLKNHWRRDTSSWKEDASRPRKKSKGAKNLALLRGAVLRLLPLDRLPSLNAAFDHNQAHR